MADKDDPIVLDDDDDVQCLGNSPPPNSATVFHGTTPTARTAFNSHNRNTHAPNNARAGASSPQSRNTSHFSNHNRNITRPPPASPSASVKSEGCNSSKRRKIQQASNGRELLKLNYKFSEAYRNPEDRSRESSAEAPSPRSSASGGSGSHIGDQDHDTPQTPTRSHISINNSTHPSNRTADTTLSLGASIVSTPSKSPKFGTTHTGARVSFSSDKAIASESFSAGSDVTNFSRASSGLSDPPNESRNISFATFQNNLRVGGGSNASSNNSNSSRASSGLNSPPQSDRGSLELASPPRLGRLTLEESQFPREIIELADDSDDEIQITDVTNNGWGKEDTPLGGPHASLNSQSRGQSRSQSRGKSVEAAQGSGSGRVQNRSSKSPTSPKRKRDEVVSDDEEESGSQVSLSGSDGGSTRFDSALRSVHGSLEQDREIANLDEEFPARHISRDSGSRSLGSPSRGVLVNELEVINLDDEEEKVFDGVGDDAEEFDEEYSDDDGEDDDDLLLENPISCRGHRASPIDIEDGYGDAYSEDDDIQVISSNCLVSQPRPSVAAPSRRRSTVIPKRNPEIVYPLEDIGSIIHRGWELKKGTFLEVLDLDGTDTTYLLINHVIRNHVTNTITIRGHRFERARNVFGMLKRTQNEMCRMLEVDEDDDRDPLVQGQIEVGLEACICKPRPINITNRLYGRDPGTCTYRTAKLSPELRRAVDQLRQRPDFPGSWIGVFKKLRTHAITEKGLLACRWECIRFWPTARARVYGDVRGELPKMLGTLKASDSQLMGNRVRRDEEVVRKEWRGGDTIVMGGSYIPGAGILPSGFFQLENGVVHKVRVTFDTAGGNEEFSRIQDTIAMDLTRSDEVVSAHGHGGRSAHLDSSSLPSIIIDLTDPTPIPPSGSIRSSIACSSSSGSSLSVNQALCAGPLKRGPGQKYTYGDAFCGAGGTTRGAVMADLKVLWGFDIDTHACSSWHRNFKNAAIYQMDAYSVVTSKPMIDLRCDILHMSPPCQTFSPAHTIAGKGDEANSAALFAVQEILRRAKPRVVTLEQTSGITNPQHKLSFQSLIAMFTALEYSVRYKVCQLPNWGLPQRRSRLIIIAAAPGEVLPEIPAYTHAKFPSGNLKPWTSAANTIDSIPPNAPNHNLASATVFERPKEPWDATSICPKAVTCSGGQNYHYGGKRMLTNREFAAIQGFPMEHVFGSRHVKKQIGNAVPPVVAKVLLEACRRALEEADGVEKEVISLDDD